MLVSWLWFKARLKLFSKGMVQMLAFIGREEDQRELMIKIHSMISVFPTLIYPKILL
jgi:hypothetical protein